MSRMTGAWHPDTVIEPRFAWRMTETVPPTAELLDAGARLGLGTRTVGLLASRGIDSGEALDAFFATPDAGLHDPRQLPDADRFVERLVRARAGGERVMVFGDFDADGLTGLAILVRALRRFGVEAVPYVPSRLDEGHGLSRKALAAAEEAGARVIVTVDCGSTSLPEIA